MNENENQEQQTTQTEQTGMSRSFSENPSMELLNNRRIDQLVAKKEQERQAIANSINTAKMNGIAEGIDTGRQEGFRAGREYIPQSGSGLGDIDVEAIKTLKNRLKKLILESTKEFQEFLKTNKMLVLKLLSKNLMKQKLTS